METSSGQPSNEGRATKSAFLLGDRAAMERERLERQRKRRRDAGLPEDEGDSSLKTLSTEKAGTNQSIPVARAEKTARLSPTASVSHSNGLSSSHASAKQPDLYWDGMVLVSTIRPAWKSCPYRLPLILFWSRNLSTNIAPRPPARPSKISFDLQRRSAQTVSSMQSWRRTARISSGCLQCYPRGLRLLESP